MRARIACIILALICTLSFPGRAAADDWSRYENARYGYSVDVPPGFEPMGEAENGDGQQFRGGFGTQVLTIFGSTVTEDSFEAEIAQRQAWAEGDGWVITDQAVTPGWANYSGQNGSRKFAARAISMCGGAQMALLQLEYFAVDSAELGPVIDRLGASLSDAGAIC